MDSRFQHPAFFYMVNTEHWSLPFLSCLTSGTPESRGMTGTFPPLLFHTGETGAEVPFHNSIIGNFMFNKDETNRAGVSKCGLKQTGPALASAAMGASRRSVWLSWQTPMHRRYSASKPIKYQTLSLHVSKAGFGTGNSLHFACNAA